MTNDKKIQPNSKIANSLPESLFKITEERLDVPGKENLPGGEPDDLSKVGFKKTPNTNEISIDAEDNHKNDNNTFRITDSKDIGEVSNKKLSANIGSYINKAAFGFAGSAINSKEISPKIKFAASVLGTIVLGKTLFSKEISLIDKIRYIAGKFAEGEIGGRMIEGNNGEKSFLNSNTLLLGMLMMAKGHGLSGINAMSNEQAEALGGMNLSSLMPGGIGK